MGMGAGTGLRWCGTSGSTGGTAHGGTNGSSVVRHATARTGLRWCGTWRHEQVFSSTARGGTNESVSGAVLSGMIGSQEVVGVQERGRPEAGVLSRVSQRRSWAGRATLCRGAPIIPDHPQAHL